MTLITFNSWPDLKQHCIQMTGCKPFSGAGINYRSENNTCLLRSVDGTDYYNDDLTNPETPHYTCQGKSGDQSETQLRFNEPLLNAEKVKHIYLYRVKKEAGKQFWIWYGKYTIAEKTTQRHPGEDGLMRNIIVLKLQRVAV